MAVSASVVSVLARSSSDEPAKRGAKCEYDDEHDREGCRRVSDDPIDRRFVKVAQHKRYDDHYHNADRDDPRRLTP